MAHADVFVIATNLNFEKREGWQRRHKIAGRHADQWLTIPVNGSQNSLIKNVTISNHYNWRRKHTKALQQTYAHTPEQQLLHNITQVYYQQHWHRLVDLNMALIRLIKEALGVTTHVVLDEKISGTKENLITNICQKYNADVYLSGLGGKQYMTNQHYRAFKKCGFDCAFVPRNVTGAYPYSSVHYLLSRGRKATARLL